MCPALDGQIMFDEVAKGIMVIHEDFKVYLGQDAYISKWPNSAGQIVG